MSDESEIYQGIDLNDIGKVVMIENKEIPSNILDQEFIYFLDDDKFIQQDDNTRIETKEKKEDELIYSINDFDVNDEMTNQNKIQPDLIYSINIPNSNISYIREKDNPLIQPIDFVDTFTLPAYFDNNKLNNNDKMLIFSTKNYTKIEILKKHIENIDKIIYEINNLRPFDQTKYNHLFDLYSDGQVRINPEKVEIYRYQLLLEQRELLKELLDYQNLDRVIID